MATGPKQPGAPETVEEFLAERDIRRSSLQVEPWAADLRSPST